MAFWNKQNKPEQIYLKAQQLSKEGQGAWRFGCKWLDWANPFTHVSLSGIATTTKEMLF